MPDFSISDFLAWARTKPADELYNFCNARTCAIAQFGRDTGRAHLIGIKSWDIPLGLSPVVNTGNWDGPKVGDYSFGNLVKRLEKLVQETPPSEWTKADAYLTEQVDA